MTGTEKYTPLVVCRAVYWDTADGERLRVISANGSFWDPCHPDGSTAAQCDACAAVLGGGHPDVAMRRNGSGPWHRIDAGTYAATETPSDHGCGHGRLHVEVTQAELSELAAGKMPHALRTRIKRALDVALALPYPDRYAVETLPRPCRVSTRGRKSGAQSPDPATPAVEVPRPDPITRPNGELYYPRTIGSRTDVEMIRSLHADGRSVLLYSAPGTGKTAALEAAFAVTGFVYVAGGADTTADDFVGGFVPEPGGSFRWVDGPLLVAMERGVPLLIDEVALIDPRILSSVVYAPMDGRGELPVVQNPLRGTVKAQPGFNVHGACNPDAPGAMMSEALTSRFVAQVEYGTDYELARKLGAPAAVIAAARNLEAKRLSGETTYAPQMRELLAYVNLARLFDDETALANMVGCAPAMDRPVVADVLSRSVGREINTLRIGE